MAQKLKLKKDQDPNFVWAKIDRSNLFRFIRKMDYGAVSAKRISKLLLKIEDHLGIPHREVPIKL